MTRRTHTWLLAFALLGLVASASSTYVHYRILRDPSYTSICDINQTFSCESAYTSRYGTIRGVPVALAGLIWFSFAVVLLLAAGPVKDPSAPDTGGELAQNVAAYLYAMSTVGLGAVIYFAYASFFVLRTACMFCVLTYVAMIGLFIVSGGATDATFGSIPRRAWRDVQRLRASPAALALALLFLVATGAGLVLFPGDGDIVPAGSAPTGAPAVASKQGTGSPGASNPSQQEQFDRWFDSQPRVPLDIASDGASVLIVKFNDFQCPSCADTYFRHKAVLAKYQAEYPGRVKQVAVDFPLAPECNANLSTVVHAAACAGAVAVRLARRVGKEEAMEEWLYSHQRGLMPEDVRQAVRDVAGVTDFDREYARLLPAVKQEADLGGRLAIQGTPTFFINGVRLEGAIRPEYLEAAIAHELKRLGIMKQ